MTKTFIETKGAEGGEAAPPALDENGQPILPADGAPAPVQLGEDGQPIPAADGAAPVEAVPEPEVIDMRCFFEEFRYFGCVFEKFEKAPFEWALRFPLRLK